MTTTVSSVLDLLLAPSSTSQLLDAVSRRLRDGTPLPVLYDELLTGAEDHVVGLPRAQRAAARLDLSCRLSLLVVEMRAQQRPKPIARALLCGSGPTARMDMAVHVIESCGYAVSPVPSHDLASLADLAAAWGDVRHLAVDGSLLAGAETRGPVVQAVARLAERSPGTRVHVLVPPGTGGAVYAIAGALTLDSLTAVGVAVGEHLRNPLTAREVDVLDQVSRGRSNTAIAKDTGLPVGTVKGHLARVQDKLGTVDRASAVAVALRRGWIS